MIKPFLFLITFCVFVLLQSFFVRYDGKTSRVYNYHIASHQQDTIKKAVAAQKAKGLSLLQKLIKPFKFRANEKARIVKDIHNYIYKDSLAAMQQSAATVKQVKGLTDSMLILQKHLKSVVTQTQLIKLLDSIKHTQHKADSIANSKPATVVKPAPADTPAKEKNATPVIAGASTTQQPKADDAKQQQIKLNLIRKLYKNNITIEDTSKNKDTARIKELSVGHKMQILGFYADTAHSNISSFNFKQLTTFVYATNQIDGNAVHGELAANSFVLDSAKNAGCNVVLSLYNNSASSTSKFLNSNSEKNNLIARAVKLLQQHNADGININFNGLRQAQKGYFVSFIASLYGALHKPVNAKIPHYTLDVTIPANDKGVAYDIVALNKYATNFIIDFSTVTQSPGPLEPLNNGSNNSVETCFALYLDQGIPPAKFILGVSYQGVVWQNQPQKFLHYITYTSVRTNYSDATVIYNKGESAAHIEADYLRTYIDIWYDDEKTLGEKYDYAITNALGGVAIKSLGDDSGYGELQKELAYKLLKIDTAIVGTIIIKHTFITELANFIQLLVTSPCGQHINPIYSRNLFLINIIFIVVLLAGAGILFYQVKKQGEAWIWRKKLIYALMVLFALWTFVFLMWLFFWDKNPYFGPSDGKVSAHCINISFIVLYIVLLLGILVGVFIRWIYQLNNQDDRP